MTSRPPAQWLETLPPDARGLLELLLGHEAAAQALNQASVLDVRVKAGADGAPPLMPHATALAIDPAVPQDATGAVDAVHANQHCIVLRGVLQWLPDYRGFLQGCFRKLRIGGHLVVAVPHQFLYERKLYPPSRVTPGHLRFYTPGTLLLEVEEALDPGEYRIRLLVDDDRGHDYGAPLNKLPSGAHDIVLCIEKLRRPAWCDQLERSEAWSTIQTKPPRVPPLDGAAPPVYRVIAPDDRAVARIIVLKLDHRGDFLMAQRAFRTLRAAFPQAAITLVCGSWNRSEAEAWGLFDTVVPFDFFAEDASADTRAIGFDELSRQLEARLQGTEYDLAIDLRLYDDTRALLHAIKARHKAGFDSYDDYPWLTIRLPIPTPTRDGAADRFLVPASEFESSAGRHRWTEIAFPGRRLRAKQHLVWGPHMRLRPGRYDIELLIDPAYGRFDVFYDLVTDGAATTIARGAVTVEPDRHPHVALYAGRTLERLECRLMAAKTGRVPKFTFKGMLLARHGAFIGVHQSEAMVLLAHLVAQRMEAAFLVTEA